MSTDIDSLHPHARDLISRVDRPGVTPFHLLSLQDQRDATTKMQFAYRPPAPDVALASEGSMGRPAEEGGPLRYRYYRALGSDPAEALPVLLWLHGGGWTIGNIESYDVVCRELANLARCAVVSVAYRLAPEHPFPAAVDDAFYAVQWLSAHAGRLHLDGNRIAVGGDSAGGNLATVTALRAREEDGPDLVFQLLVYPATDQRGLTASHQRFAQGFLLTQESIRYFQQCYLPKSSDFMNWRASPFLAPSLAGLPPALIITASHDPLVDDCNAYAARLQREGVPVKVSCYQGMIHSFFTLGKACAPAVAAVQEAGQALAQAFA